MGAVLAIAALVAVAILASKPAPNETIVVLPAPDGHVGGVVVQRGDDRQVLDRAYAGIRRGETKVSQLPDSEVQHLAGRFTAASGSVEAQVHLTT